MIIVDKRPARKPITFADIEVGTLFSLTDRANVICIKTRVFSSSYNVKVNSVNLSTGILYHFEPYEEVVPIDNYEFNIF